MGASLLAVAKSIYYFNTPVLFLLLDEAVPGICIGCCWVVCRLVARPLVRWSAGPLVRWSAGPLGRRVTGPLYDERTSFCRYMKIVRFHSTELSVCKPFWLVEFFHYWGFSFLLNLLSPLLIIIFVFLIIFMFLQGGLTFALKTAHLKDLELRKLAADLPLRTFEAKAPSTTERYSRVFRNRSEIIIYLITRSLACHRTRYHCSLFRVPDSGWFPLFFPWVCLLWY